MRFTDGYTCGPNCQPTRAALMSGQYGPRTGVYTVGGIDRFDWQSRPLRPVDNVAEAAAGQGHDRPGAQEGRLRHRACSASGTSASRASTTPASAGSTRRSSRWASTSTSPPRRKVDYPTGTYLADFLTDQAVDFITRHKDGPFFLYLPHFGVHSPHQAKKELIAKFKDKPAAGGGSRRSSTSSSSTTILPRHRSRCPGSVVWFPAARADPCNRVLLRRRQPHDHDRVAPIP